MESQPKFIKDFSKEEAQSERDQLAWKIKDKRKTYLNRKEFESNDGKDESLEHEVLQLSDTIRNISDYLPSKISDFLKYLKIGSRFTSHSKEKILDGEDAAMDEPEADLSDPMNEAKVAISSFYENQKERWKDAPYSKEDIRQSFSPEHLASLSLEEYTLLMKRFPSEMLTHVTRQGIRDHVGAVNHNAGVNKMWNGFKQIVGDGHLRSAFSIHVTEKAKKDEIATFLNLQNKTREDAHLELDYLAGEETQHHHGSFADVKSLHLATEEVANAHYGAETGNEIFFAYPSALIASQYVFNGQLSEQSGGYHNNQWIFFNEDDGLDIDAGIVFIPKDTRVDQITGSKYELDENLEPIKNHGLCAQIESLISQDDFKQFAKEYEQVLGKTRINVGEFVRNGNEQNSFQEDTPQKLVEALQVLEDKFSITDKRVQETVLDYSFLIAIQDSNREENRKESFIFTRLREIGLEFEHAQHTVSSEQYWQEYFNTNNERRPSKIVFYDEHDPTSALKNWRIRNDLFKTDGRADFGFEENSVDLADPQDVKSKVPSISRFKALAEGIIDEFYS